MFGPVHALHPAAQAAAKNNINGLMATVVLTTTYLPTQFPVDEFRNVPPPQASAVHTLGDAPRRVSELLQVKQCAGLAGLEQLAQESSHPAVWSNYVASI